MFTVERLRQYPSVVKAFTDLPAEEFWALVAAVSGRWADEERVRRARPDRQRAVGGGRHSAQPLALRVAAVLTYLRLHVPQQVVGLLFGTSQAAVSRALRDVLPALRPCLPCPAVWEPVADAASLPAEAMLAGGQLADGRALIDATEQRVSRPGDDATQRRYYSGKKQAHTLKTQLVTDGDHHILAISAAVPRATHDKPLCDALHTMARLPDGIEAERPRSYRVLPGAWCIAPGCCPRRAPVTRRRAGRRRATGMSSRRLGPAHGAPRRHPAARRAWRRGPVAPPALARPPRRCVARCGWTGAHALAATGPSSGRGTARSAWCPARSCGAARSACASPRRPRRGLRGHRPDACR